MTNILLRLIACTYNRQCMTLFEQNFILNELTSKATVYMDYIFVTFASQTVISFIYNIDFRNTEFSILNKKYKNQPNPLS